MKYNPELVSENNGLGMTCYNISYLGRVLAIGYSSGIIRLFNVDTSDMIHELSRKSMGDDARADSAPIMFLCWEQDSVNFDSEVRVGLHLFSDINTFIYLIVI